MDWTIFGNFIKGLGRLTLSFNIIQNIVNFVMDVTYVSGIFSVYKNPYRPNNSYQNEFFLSEYTKNDVRRGFALQTPQGSIQRSLETL